MSRSIGARFGAALACLLGGILAGAVPAGAQELGPILPELTTISTVASTVPSNGDVNPYGVARVPRTIGALQQGDILVSNFNNKKNLQGTGTTIMEIAPGGSVHQFAQIDASTLPGLCPGGVGLTTALVVLRTGWVIVGSLPTTDGTAATAQAGCLIVIDRNGKPAETFAGTLINGPWDMTALDGDGSVELFFTNVLNGTVAANGKVVDGGTVVRLDMTVSTSRMPVVESLTVIASGLPERTDPAALVIGPTGLALGRPCGACVGVSPLPPPVLYVADTLRSRVAVIGDPLGRVTSAGAGVTLTSGGHLNTPLGLTVAPNGDILTVNGGNGLITEITPHGVQVATRLLDRSGSPPGAGTLFGLTTVGNDRIYFVDDGTNTLNLLH